MKKGFWMGLLSLLLLLGACEEVANNYKPKSTAFGPINQVNIIADSSVWTAVEDTFSYFLETPYPLLPQPEPLFDMRFFTPHDLRVNTSRRKLRLYLMLATLEDTSSATLKLLKSDLKDNYTQHTGDNGYNIKIGEDKWAKNQRFIYIYGKTEEDLKTAISEHFSSIAGQIRAFERKTLDAKVYVSGENKTLMKAVQDSFGIRMRLPQKTKLSPISDDRLMWLRLESKEASQSILIHKLPYQDATQLSKENMINLRNELTKVYIEGSEPNSYMKVDDINLPVFYEKVKIGGLQAYEIRGIWEMEDAFQGGPFVTYMILGPNLESIYFVDVFVYAPGSQKRDLLQQLEHIVSTFSVL